MRDKPRRLRSIEVALTPRQVVFLWISNAQKTHNFESMAPSRPPRSEIANAVYASVRKAMKGQPEPLIEQAVRQGRQEADQLFMLVIEMNSEVVRSRRSRLRECFLLLAHVGTLTWVPLRSECVELLRSGVEIFVGEVGSLRSAIQQIATDHFNGREVLFGDTKRELEEQLQMACKLCAYFNALANRCGLPQLDYPKIRRDIETGRRARITGLLWDSRLASVAVLDDAASIQKTLAELWREQAEWTAAGSRLDQEKLGSDSGRPENNDEATDKRPAWFAQLVQRARAELQIDTML